MNQRGLREHRSSPERRSPPAWFGIGLAMTLIASACSGGLEGPPTNSAPNRAGASHTATIAQPALSNLNERTRRRLAPDARRVDLAVPSFSDPTNINNPLFPIDRLQSAVLVGKLQGRPWRAETTLLPYTKEVAWNGQRVATLQSQFIAFRNGRIFEVAVDHYAQADDGSVWYFGEDAFTYKDGVVADTEGTWLAGEQGPPAMIMPAHPRIGDVYRTENIPGLVFEQVTVKKVGVTLNGPVGPIHGAMIGQELHMDEVRLENKTFAPGYGEFFSGHGPTYEANALAIPVDAVDEPTPVQLTRVNDDAVRLLTLIRSAHWIAASITLAQIRAAWSGLLSTHLPTRLSTGMDTALKTLARSIRLRDLNVGLRSAFTVAQVGLDLRLRYQPAPVIDRARFDLWTRHLEADALAQHVAAVRGDVATLDWVRDRLSFAESHGRLIDDELRHLTAAAEAGEFRVLASGAAQIRNIFTE